MSGNPEPYGYADAKAAIERATRAQVAAEQAERDAYASFATAERAYRMALAQEITKLHAEGVAWSSTADLARGEKHVADLRYSRDVAEGVKAAAQSARFRHTANRRELEQLVQWSMRVSPDGQHEPVNGFEDVSARRAA